jgi:hypothetical protein
LIADDLKDLRIAGDRELNTTFTRKTRQLILFMIGKNQRFKVTNSLPIKSL